jgi:hypothetical protein
MIGIPRNFAANSQPRIGFLAISRGLGQHLVAAFREGLRDRGWVEGQNVIIE